MLKKILYLTGLGFVVYVAAVDASRAAGILLLAIYAAPGVYAMYDWRKNKNEKK